MIKYCDRCKWDEDSGSKFIPDGVDAENMTDCPLCKSELHDLERREDRP